MNRANNNPTDGNGTKFLITGLITGGILGYVFTRSYLNVKRNHEERDDSVDENEIEDNSAQVQEETTKPEEQKVELSIMDMLYNSLMDNLLYERGDVLVVDQEENDDPSEWINNIYPQYTRVREVEAKDGHDGYVSILIKLEDKLLSKNRNRRVKDPSYDMIKEYVDDILDSRFEYRRIGHSSKPIGFYFFSDEDVDENKIKLKELRELESICGFRYIEFRLYRLNKDKNLGLQLLDDILEGFHPDGGEDGTDMRSADFMPIILDRTENGIHMSEENNIVSDFLRRDSRVITDGEE